MRIKPFWSTTQSSSLVEINYLVCWEDPREQCTRRYQNHLKNHFIHDWHFRKKNISHSKYVLRFQQEKKALQLCQLATTNTASTRKSHWLNNLFRFTDTKTAFVTCQLSAVPPLGHWFLEGVHPARLRSHPEAATLSLLAWWRQLSSLQL